MIGYLYKFNELLQLCLPQEIQMQQLQNSLLFCRLLQGT